MNIDSLISVAAVMNNDAKTIELFLQETKDVLDENYANYEIVLIDNGSSDDSVKIVTELQTKMKRIRLIVLSKQYADEITYSTFGVVD